MTAVGERMGSSRLSKATIEYLGKGQTIQTAGGLAVIKTWAETSVVSPWLIGVAAHNDGSSSFASHHLVKFDPGKDCTVSIWCRGAVISPEGEVTQALGHDPLNARARYLELAGIVRRPSNEQPLGSQQTLVNPELARAFYDAGHTFDPDMFPVLHAAMRTAVELSS